MFSPQIRGCKEWFTWGWWNCIPTLSHPSAFKILYNTNSPGKCTSTVNNLSDDVASVRINTVKHRAVYSRDCTFVTTQGWASEQLCGWWACSGPGRGTRAHLNETASHATSSPPWKGQASKQWHLPGSGAFSLHVRQIAAALYTAYALCSWPALQLWWCLSVKGSSSFRNSLKKGS